MRCDPTVFKKRAIFQAPICQCLQWAVMVTPPQIWDARMRSWAWALGMLASITALLATTASTVTTKTPLKRGMVCASPP